jgi:hypothetical protein
MRSNNLTQLVPLAIGVALVAGLTWVLLDRDVALGRWLLAALILGHGLAHLAFVVPTPEPAKATGSGMEWPFDLGRSWPVTRIGLDGRIVRGAGAALTAVTIVTSLLAALATVGILVPLDWWSGLVVSLAVSSLLLITVCFSPILLNGFAIDLALLWLALLSGWSPAG